MMTTQTLLLTGFEPFGRWDINPSWEAARTFDGENIGGLHVVAHRLPVDWDMSWPALLKAIDERDPRWVLMLGQAARRTTISVESVARNACSDTPDNMGKQAAESLVVPGGDTEIAVTLPVDAIIERIQASGVPVERSVDAGGYLCNHTLYRALAWAKSAPGSPSIGFIHVPGLPSDDPERPGMALDAITRATRAAVTAIAEAASKPSLSI